MFNTLTQFFTNLMRKFIPDAFVFALLLTLIVFISALSLTDYTFLQLIDFWGNGFWNLLSFSMQMSLILIFGFTLAKTTLIQRSLDRLASLAKTNTSGVLVLTLSSLMACYLNWGFGLIFSGLLAVKIGNHLNKCNFGLLVASAYSGFLVWHGGLSGSIPLKLTAPNADVINIIGEKNILLTDTLFSSLNLLLLIVVSLTVLILNYVFSKNNSFDDEVVIQNTDDVNTKTNSNESFFSVKAENSRFLVILISLFFSLYLLRYFYKGNSLTLNTMILLFLAGSFFLSQTSKVFIQNFNTSVKESSGILLQFPFYAGLMGIVSMSGLGQLISEFFIQISSEKTFLFFTYLSAGLLNFFVPSGGGQWAIQSPIMLPAAKELGVSFADTSMAIAWGDAWSNMIQPFWALPILSLARMDLNKMMGYCAVIFIVVGVSSSFVFLVWPYL